MRRELIESELVNTFSPMHVEVVDESHMHNVPTDAQSHFKVTLVSDKFTGKTLIARHREVNAVLQKQFDEGLHALALHTMTPEEWFEKGGTAPTSPPCLGGSAGQDKT